MSVPSASRRDRLREMLADLRLPGALESGRPGAADVDGGAATAAEAIERLLAAQIALRNWRSSNSVFSLMNIRWRCGM